jgi:hypothetical protein
MGDIMGGLMLYISFWIIETIQGCGGGGSVRRRNTLHVVGGRQLSLSQARFTGREKRVKKKRIKYSVKIENILQKKL